MQPYDYSGAFSTINPRQVTAELQGLEQNRLAIDSARQQQQQLQGLRAATTGTDWTNPEQVAALQGQFPGLLEEIGTQQAFALGQQQIERENVQQLTDDQKKRVNKASNNMLLAAKTGDTEAMLTSIRNNQEIINSSGDQAVTAELLEQMAINEPDKFMGYMQEVSSQTGGEPIEARKLDLQEKNQRAERRLNQRKQTLEEAKQKITDAKNDQERRLADFEYNSALEERELYGSGDKSEMDQFYREAAETVAIVDGIDRSMNITLDLMDLSKRESLKGRRARKMLTDMWEWNPSVDTVTKDAMMAALQSGTLDIALLQSAVLKPVSEQQFNQLQAGLTGGTLEDSLEALRGTRGKEAGRIDTAIKGMKDRNAGLHKTISAPGEFIRNKDQILKERIEQGLIVPPPAPPPGQLIEPDEIYAYGGGVYRYLGGNRNVKENWEKIQ